MDGRHRGGHDDVGYSDRVVLRTKKTEKTPPREIEIALARMKEIAE